MKILVELTIENTGGVPPDGGEIHRAVASALTGFPFTQRTRSNQPSHCDIIQVEPVRYDDNTLIDVRSSAKGVRVDQ